MSTEAQNPEAANPKPQNPEAANPKPQNPEAENQPVSPNPADTRQVLTSKEAKELIPRLVSLGIKESSILGRYRLRNGELVIDKTTSIRNGEVRRETVSVKTEKAAKAAAAKAKTWSGKAIINGKNGYLKITPKGITFNGRKIDASNVDVDSLPKEAFGLLAKIGTE